jgi:hypothetical protein
MWQEILALYVNSNWGVEFLLTLSYLSWSSCAPRLEDVCGSGGITPSFFTSAIDKFDWLALRPGSFASGERAPGTHWIRGGRVWTLWHREKSHVLVCNFNSCPSPRSVAAILTELSRLLVLCSTRIFVSKWMVSVQPRQFSPWHSRLFELALFTKALIFAILYILQNSPWQTDMPELLQNYIFLGYHISLSTINSSHLFCTAYHMALE